MRKTLVCLLLGCLPHAPIPVVAEPDEILVTVNADRVNLRARAGTEVEVVGQAAFGDKLRAKSLGDEWVEIYPPPGTRAWVHGKFVEQGRVSAKRLNLRAGPGINYSVLGQLTRNESVAPVDTFDNWLAVEAPDRCSLFISRQFVDPVNPVPPQPESVQVAPPRFLPRDLRLLQGLHLTPQPGQGRAIRREGVIAPVSYLLGRPSRYRLAVGEDDAHETLCYLLGEDAEFARLVNRAATVHGRQYVVREARHPVLIVDRIDAY